MMDAALPVGCDQEAAGEPSPGADVARGEPSPGADVARGEPQSRRRCERMSLKGTRSGTTRGALAPAGEDGPAPYGLAFRTVPSSTRECVSTCSAARERGEGHLSH